MYLIDTEKNRIINLNRKTFSDLRFSERNHLQKWIAHSPKVFGEDDELLIIAEEFDKFSDTRERLDLLAIDKKGDLVIIENKLDDTGRDVTWQALKYASYCSTLTTEEIINILSNHLQKHNNQAKALDIISDFLGQKYTEENLPSLNQGNKQRIIFIAANFRKEVTSTVLWLMNYSLRIQCFKASVFSLEDEKFFFTLEQIIPTKDAEDYMIRMAQKTQVEISNQESEKTRHQIRFEFWSQLLPKLKGKTSIFQNSSPTKDHWLSAGGTNIRHSRYTLIITRTYAGIQLEFGRPNKEENKKLFDELEKYKSQIEKTFGNQLVWEKSEGTISSKVGYYLEGVNIFNSEDWNKISNFLTTNIIKFESALKQPLIEIKQVLNSTDETENE